MARADLAEGLDDADGVAVPDADVEERLEVAAERDAADLLGERLGERAARARDDVRDARVRRREAAGAAADEERRLEVARRDLDRVRRVRDGRERRAARDERGRDVRRQAAGAVQLGDAEELDGAVELAARVLEVDRLEPGDARARDERLVDVDAEGEADEDRELRPRVEAADVERRILLRVAERRRLGEAVGVAQALGLHLRQHEVRAPVHDAAEPRDLVADEVRVHRVDDGDAAADGGLVPELDAGRAGALRGVRLGDDGLDLGQAVRDERLVGRDDVLARAQRAEDDVLGERRAAHDLDDEVDVVVACVCESIASGPNKIDGTVTSAPVAAEHRLEVLGDDAPGRRGPVARLGRVAHDDRLDLEAHAARRRHELLAPALQDLDDAPADRPAADDADLADLRRQRCPPRGRRRRGGREREAPRAPRRHEDAQDHHLR